MSDKSVKCEISWVLCIERLGVYQQLSFASSSATVLTVPAVIVVVADVAVFNMAAMGANFIAG